MQGLKILVQRFDIESYSDVSANSSNFRRLVLFFIEADFASKDSFFSIFRHLQDKSRFANLCTAQISKFQQNFVKLLHIFAQFSNNSRYFSTLFIKFCSDFDEIFSEFRRIFQKMMKDDSEILKLMNF